MKYCNISKKNNDIALIMHQRALIQGSGPEHSLGKNKKLHEMKNEKNYMAFLIHKIQQILKRFAITFC